VIPRPEVFRQSLLRGFTVCARRTLHGLKVGDDAVTGWVTDRGHLGTAFHEFQRRYLSTLAEQDERQMPTQEAVEVMYEVLATLPFALPGETLDELRYLVLGFCDIPWEPRLLRSAMLEEELRAEVECPDGVVRVLKGTPDVLMFDPPAGLVVADAKTGRGRPRGPRTEPEPGEIIEGREYLSDLFQLEVYAYLGMRKFPAVRYVTGREFHLRSGQVRQTRLSREELEHVERKLAVTMMLLDRAIREGEDSDLWGPRPGSHCARQCPVARSCPVPQEMRGDGAIVTVADAAVAAETWAALEGQREALRSQLKAYVEDPVNPVPAVNEVEVIGWKPPTGKGRRFGIWRREDIEMEGEAA